MKNKKIFFLLISVSLTLSILYIMKYLVFSSHTMMHSPSMNHNLSELYYMTHGTTVPVQSSNSKYMEFRTTVHVPNSNDVELGNTVHLPNSNDVEPGTTVHVPNSNDVELGNTVHLPNSNDVEPGTTVHVPNSNDMEPGTTVHVPNSNDVEPGTTVHVANSNSKDIEHGSTLNVPTSSIFSDQRPSNPTIHNLSHVVINRDPGKAIHHIFSAYFDSRKLPGRPFIIMFGYFENKKKDSFYCKAVYEDGRTKCLGEVKQKPLKLHDEKSTTYTCKLNSYGTIPTHVILCERDKCEDCKNSKPIPVRNREKKDVTNGMGVCVEGPLNVEKISNEKIFDMVVQFLATVKVLGVQTVTIYNLNAEKEIVLQILELFPGLVDMVQWEKPAVWIHYRGQIVLLQDCLYRNMYRVKYLGFIDLDEMIFPVSTDNWNDMFKILEEKGQYASYYFSNNFFAEIPNAVVPVDEHSCPHLNIPPCFLRLERLPWYNRIDRSKVIARPNLISAMAVHGICPPLINGYQKMFWVPKSIGMMAHYRDHMLKDMIQGKPTRDNTAMKYKDLVMQEMKRVCFHTSI